MSFISVEPQSRVALESHSNSLLAQFTTQVEIIADRYLAFFQERRRIEATYIDSLRKLYRKAKTVDTPLNPRAERTTTRAAWDKSTAVAEANTQQAFVDILDNDVIKPLKTLKESKDRTRRRIEDDLKRSAANYADHAEDTISRLQQAYLKKYYPQQYAHFADSSQRSQDVPNKRFGGKVSALFRGRREDLREPEPAKSEEVFDDDCRLAVSQLNEFRLRRVENLGDGYDCLKELVFLPTVKDVLVKYMGGQKSRKPWPGTDTSNLRASFRRGLSFSIPSPTLYRNYRLGADSDLIFGVPLTDVETDQDNVPNVVRMCIEEVEKRGLDTKGIYSVGQPHSAEFRRRFESDKSFSFSPTDNIHSVAMLLRRYLLDLPESLFILSLEDYRNYGQNRARYTENDFSLLRSKIRGIHPAHKAPLGALLRHLSRVASQSDKNAMTVEALAAQFCYTVLRGNIVLQGTTLVMEDLIRNARTLFDERSSPSSPVPSSDVAETTSTFTSSSLLLTPELPRPAEAQAMGSTTRHRPELVGGIPTSTQSSFSSLPSDAAAESRRTPSQTALLSPLLGLPSSQTLTEGVEMTTEEHVIPEVRGTKAVELLPNSTLAEVVSVPPTSVAEWRLHQSRLSPHPEAVMIPQSPPESVLSGTSDFPLSSATSLQTGMGRFSQ
ncbi:hypothetical protein BJY52DRAFT_1189777 [Lactarius psammicola]|nr:hypothetical protein BJY52DRAFT_1189777 [Lactarius psammicola]